MTTPNLHSLTIKEIVTENFQAAAIFEKHSLDFCCRGGKTIHEACREKGLDPERIFAEISQLTLAQGESPARFAEWSPDFLVDYILINHHTFVARTIPVLRAHTQKVAAVHGANHPEVVRIAECFGVVANELSRHMVKEEKMLFPYIKQLAAAERSGGFVASPPFGSARNPIAMMEREHQQAGDALYDIRGWSGGYTPPEDACTTYRVLYAELREFERDLHQHVHLENNILFPSALALESSVA